MEMSLSGIELSDVCATRLCCRRAGIWRRLNHLQRFKRYLMDAFRSMSSIIAMMRYVSICAHAAAALVERPPCQVASLSPQRYVYTHICLRMVLNTKSRSLCFAWQL